MSILHYITVKMTVLLLIILLCFKKNEIQFFSEYNIWQQCSLNPLIRNMRVHSLTLWTHP